MRKPSPEQTLKAFRWQKEWNTLWNKVRFNTTFERITDLFSEGGHCVKLWCRERLQDNHTCKEHAKLRHDGAAKPQKWNRKCSWRWQRLITGSNTSNTLHTFSSCSVVHLSSSYQHRLHKRCKIKMKIISEDHFTVSPDKAKYRLNVRHYLRHKFFTEAQMIYLEIHHLKLLKDAHRCFPLFWRAAEE